MKRDYVLCNSSVDYFINSLGLHPDGVSLCIGDWSDSTVVLQPINSPENGFYFKAESLNQYLPYTINTGSQTISGRILLRTSTVKPGLNLAVIGDSYIDTYIELGMTTQAIKSYDPSTTLYGIYEGTTSGNMYTGLRQWNAHNVLEDSEYNGQQNPMFHNGKFDFKNFAEMIGLPDGAIVILNFGINALSQGDSPQKALTYYLKLKKEVEKLGYKAFIVTPVTTAQMGMNVKLSEFSELLRKTVRTGLLDVSWCLPPNCTTTPKITNTPDFGSVAVVNTTNLILPSRGGFTSYGNILFQTLLYHLGYGVS